ncbi:PTS sugar transporter subunit IIA [Spiroplasma clarkii]|uniref:PTS sugar transporter subunit IIA n=1 Tax=Spiroplasma clarkii TaxID=2139 RepID=UPI000C20FF10|nr:PTS sugar transporter subunit IIA [Spiroplasma clarkii]
MKISQENVLVDLNFANKNEVLNFIGAEFSKRNWTKPEYTQSLINRDQADSVAIGSYLALVHGQQQDCDLILQEGVLVIRLANSLQWDQQVVKWVIGLALKGDNQLEFLQNIAIAFSDEADALKVYQENTSVKQICDYFNNLDFE